MIAARDSIVRLAALSFDLASLFGLEQDDWTVLDD